MGVPVAASLILVMLMKILAVFIVVLAPVATGQSPRQVEPAEEVRE